MSEIKYDKSCTYYSTFYELLIKVVYQDDDFESYLVEFIKQTDEVESRKPYLVFVEVFRSINNRDRDCFLKSLKLMEREFKYFRRSGQFFDGRFDEKYFFLGIGLVNLANHFGMDIKYDSKLIPEKLIGYKYEYVETKSSGLFGRILDKFDDGKLDKIVKDYKNSVTKNINSLVL